ncbi:head maturation protease, ClpP-related [Euzebya sp.]|uniref:head maturation protease, ClpP-related n=1 Tax=Euzebya sp. TaxID=1971409 RepID=UPI003511DD7E
MNRHHAMYAAIDRRTILSRLDQIAGTGRWYTIQNAAGDNGRATIRIFDEIGYWGVTEEDFARDLEQIDADEIEVQISSPGGEVYAGIAIYNQLRAHRARIITRVDGMAASAASVIVQAGDERLMMSSAQMMIHEAWGLCVGPAGDMRDFAELLDKQSDIIAGIYAARSGRDVAEFRDLMRTDTYLTDTEAVDLGLADSVYEPPSKAVAAATAAAAAQARRQMANATRTPLNTRTTGPQGQEDSMDLNEIREALGLAADTPDDEVIALAAERLATPPTGDPKPTDDGDPVAQVPPPPSGPPAPAEPTLPDGLIAVSAARFQEMQEQIAELAADNEKRSVAEAKSHRDGLIKAALRDGKIAKSEEKSWRDQLDEAPEAVEALLNSMPASRRVPVGELGYAGGDADTVTDEDAKYASLTADAPTYS